MTSQLSGWLGCTPWRGWLMTGKKRQTCVDVLCAYLRMPYEPDPGQDAPEQQRLVFQANREVRHTDHPGHHSAPQRGGGCIRRALNFDFNGVIFDGGDFRDAEFSGGFAVFDNAEFSGGTVRFNRAKFSRRRGFFGSAKFSGGTVRFDNAEFSGGTVSFRSTELSGGTVNFTSAQFSGGTINFSRAEFSAARSTSVSPSSPAAPSTSAAPSSPAAR